MQHDTIAVIDFGGQYAHLIGTKIRRLGVHSVICDPHDPLEVFRSMKGIIFSGSPALSSQDERDYNHDIYQLDIPILGLCFGHQEIARHYGGRIAHQQREYGLAQLRRTAESPLLAGLSETEQVFMSHGDTVVELPDGFVELGVSSIGDGPSHRFAAIADEKRRRYGVQFHPEVDDTPGGDRMLRNFAVEICGCRATWNMEAYLAEKVEETRRETDGKAVFLLASGGVDSTTLAWLLAKAVGPERLHLLHVDTGLMRQGESEQVVEAFRSHGLSDHIHFARAGETFLGRLAGKTDPEEKRLIIGNTFIEVFQELFERESHRVGDLDVVLAQGTIYPDTIESGGTKRSDKIKTHHNRVPIIEEMIAAGKVIEPLHELYKVEVRELGRTMGVPTDLLERHPFPGPGLGVRLLCADGPPEGFDPVPLETAAAEVARTRGLGVLALPVRSVGVKADRRCYQTPLMLSAEHRDWARLEVCATEIFKAVPDINRCVLALEPRAPARATAIPAHMTPARTRTLREADDAVMRSLRRHDLMQTIWQCPTVLVPVRIDDRDGELIVLRPVLSDRAMTARPAPLPEALLQELLGELLAIDGVGAVAFDLTSKPPGTIEWE